MLQELKAILSCLAQPAFILENGKLLFFNDAAQRLGVSKLPEEITEAAQAQGQQTFAIAGTQWAATVHCLAAYQLVLLQAQQSEPTQEESQILSAAARALRRPLQKMFLTASQLFPYLEDLDDAQIQAGTSSLNRSMYQMLRALGNLSELMNTSTPRMQKTRTECNHFFESLAQRARPLLESTGRQLDFQCQQKRFYADLDNAAVERAVLNLLSNAITHTPRGGVITLQVAKEVNFCRICVRNESTPLDPDVLANLFQRYAQTGTLGQIGAGFGLAIAQNVARAHHGTVLAQLGEPGGLLVVMTLEAASRSWNETIVRSPKMQLDSFGGHDPYLIELADVLPDSQFDTRDL